MERVVDTTGAGETLLEIQCPPTCLQVITFLLAGDAIAGALLAACALDQPLEEGLRWEESLYPDEEELDEKNTRNKSGGVSRKQPR